MDGKAKPVKTARSGMLRASVWDNPKTTREGNPYKQRSFTLTKSWRTNKPVDVRIRELQKEIERLKTSQSEYEDRRLPLNKSDIIDLRVMLRFIEENFHTQKEPSLEDEAS